MLTLVEDVIQLLRLSLILNIGINIEHEINKKGRMSYKIVSRINGISLDSQNIIKDESRIKHESKHRISDIIILKMFNPN
jgi:hypothetical protein